MHGYSRGVPLLLALLLSACASSGSTSERRASQDRNLLTREQISSVQFTNLYDVVFALRASWLRPRGPDSFNNPGQVKVYQDGMQLGGIATLRSISPMDVDYVRFYDGLEATSRWGLDHGQGVIFVASRSG